MNLGRCVLVCDDDLRQATFEEWFNTDLVQRQQQQQAAALRYLETDGQVCRTLAELSLALEEAREAGALPDLVLIDDRLQPERGGDPVRSALKAVRLITSTFGSRGPKCVLHTSQPDLNDVWTFCALGGHNVVDKFRPTERARILWETLDGHRWKPPEQRTSVTITDALGRMLPYMELPHWKHNARRDLPGLSEGAAHQAKSRLVNTLGLEKGAESREIVTAANDHGLAWVPLSYRHLLPQDHPEHRPDRFKHRLPPRKSDV